MSTTNTLTGLIPVIYQGLNTVARERVGAIEAVSVDVDASQVAQGQTVRTAVARKANISAITPGAYAPQNGSNVVDYVDIQITNADVVPIAWNGEEQTSVGGLYTGILTDQITEAFRAHTNAIDLAINAEVRKNASRAHGTSGQALFNTAGDLSDLAKAAQILDINGAPSYDRHVVMDSISKANLGAKQSTLFKVNEAGTTDLLRNNVIEQLQGFGLHYSNQLSTVTKGTLSAGTATAAKGDTTITVDGGTGSIVAGDVITFAGDTNEYVVLTATGTAPTTVITISKPGLINAVSAAAITVQNTYKAAWAGYKGAIKLLNRAPIMPAGGDAAMDVMMVADPLTGLQFQVALYRQYRQVILEVGIAYGVKVVKPEFIATLKC